MEGAAQMKPFFPFLLPQRKKKRLNVFIFMGGINKYYNCTSCLEIENILFRQVKYLSLRTIEFDLFEVKYYSTDLVSRGVAIN